jgi:hypothetical protein
MIEYNIIVSQLKRYKRSAKLIWKNYYFATCFNQFLLLILADPSREIDQKIASSILRFLFIIRFFDALRFEQSNLSLRKISVFPGKF